MRGPPASSSDRRVRSLRRPCSSRSRCPRPVRCCPPPPAEPQAAERLGEIRVEEPRHLVEVAVPGRIYTRGNRPGKRKEQVMSVKLFVGGLSFSTSSEGLRGAFARFGEVRSAALITDRTTGRPRGVGV